MPRISKIEKSKEKNLCIQGIVVDDPSNYAYAIGEWSPTYETIFQIELKNDLNVTFKKSDPLNLSVGDKIIIELETKGYIKKGDFVTIVDGRVWKYKHSRKKGERPDSVIIYTQKVHNETKDVSFYL